MGNRITFKNRPELESEQPLKMSNGATSAFVDVLLLAASYVASDQRERSLAIWIAQRDQHCSGLGTVGFDISELPFDQATFAQDRAFFIRSIDTASSRHGWERLDYLPQAEHLLKRLQVFRTYLEAAAPEDFGPGREIPWPLDLVDNPSKCARHDVYVHEYGCVICNVWK